MLFRLVRPVKRTGSRHRYFVRRIPSDVKGKAAGLRLSIPVGDQTQVVIITPRAQSVRLSLRTDDPAEVMDGHQSGWQPGLVTRAIAPAPLGAASPSGFE